MFGQYGIALAATAIVVCSLVVGSLFAPLIPKADSGPAGERAAAIAATEFSHCNDNLSDVDCRCFAGKAGHILTQTNDIRTRGRAANRSELARTQAELSC